MRHEVERHRGTITRKRAWPSTSSGHPDRISGVMKRAAIFAVIVLAAMVALFWRGSTSAGKIRVSLLISGGTVVTMEDSGTIMPNGAVAIDGATIVAVGTAGEL